MTASGFVDSDGARLYYEQAGSGPDILFIHAGVADLRMWDEQVEALSESFNCIRFDMRGFGQTENTAESFSPTADVASVLDHLGANIAHFVGISMGGATAVDFALEHPERVQSLCLVAAGVGGWSKPPTEPELAELEEAEKAYEAESWDRVVELEVRYWLDGPGRSGRVQGQVREKMMLMCRGAYGRGEPAARPTHLNPPAIGRLSEINAPTLILAGTYDESSIMEMADLFSTEIPNSTKIVYEGVAHMINLEQPERFTSDLLEFLKRR